MRGIRRGASWASLTVTVAFVAYIVALNWTRNRLAGDHAILYITFGMALVTLILAASSLGD